MYIGNVHLIHDDAVVATKTLATAFSDIIKASFYVSSAAPKVWNQTNKERFVRLLCMVQRNAEFMKNFAEKVAPLQTGEIALYFDLKTLKVL